MRIGTGRGDITDFRGFGDQSSLGVWIASDRPGWGKGDIDHAFIPQQQIEAKQFLTTSELPVLHVLFWTEQ